AGSLNRVSFTRRVRKFGRNRFAGESCRSQGGVTNGSGGLSRLATERSALLPDGLERQTIPADGVDLEEQGICSAENFQQRRGGASPRRHRPLRGTEKSRANA